MQENDDTDGEATTTKSRFIVEPVLEQDAGQFTCEVANRYGRDQKHFVVSIEGKYLRPFTELRSFNIPICKVSVQGYSSGQTPKGCFLNEVLPENRAAVLITTTICYFKKHH